MIKKIAFLFVFTITIFANAQTPTTDPIKTENEVVPADQVEWVG